MGAASLPGPVRHILCPHVRQGELQSSQSDPHWPPLGWPQLWFLRMLALQWAGPVCLFPLPVKAPQCSLSIYDYQSGTSWKQDIFKKISPLAFHHKAALSSHAHRPLQAATCIGRYPGRGGLWFTNAILLLESRPDPPLTAGGHGPFLLPNLPPV